MAQRIRLRHRFVALKAPFLQDKPWVKEVPSDVRDAAVIEFVQNLTTEIKKGHSFKLKFKSRLDQSCSITVRKENWSEGIWFKRTLKERLQGTEYVPVWLDHNSKIVKTKYHRFTLCVPSERQPPKVSTASNRSISLDPGVRTFMTGYDPSGEIIEIAKDDSKEVFQMCYAVDRVMKKISHAKRHKNRYQLKRAAFRLREGIKDRIKDLHRKTAKYLCENYNTIFLPKFGSSNMIKKRGRKIHSKTVRSMLTYSHYGFRMHLLHKAEDYMNCQVKIVDEAYTSKTGGNCGHIHQKLGGSKIYHCPQCGLEIDRDVNGARNIWIRSVQEVPGASCTFGALPPADNDI